MSYGYVLLCICTHPAPKGWPEWMPVGGYQCARCEGWKATGTSFPTRALRSTQQRTEGPDEQ